MAIDSIFGYRVEPVGTGAQVAFNAPFEIFSDVDLVVAVSGVVKTLYADYTLTYVSGVPGVVVTFAVAPALLAPIVIRRNVDPSRSTDFSQLSTIFSSQMNNQLDRIVAKQQEIVGGQQLVLQFDPNLPVPASTTLPAPQADKFIAWNGSATGLTNVDIATSGAIVDATTTLKGIQRNATNAEALAKSLTNATITASNLAAFVASTSLAGFVPLATPAEVTTGTDNTKAITAYALTNAGVSGKDKLFRYLFMGN